jgi:putative ABC transport system permease protein
MYTLTIQLVGLAGFILILLYVQHELSYDRYHEQADRIYRVVQERPVNSPEGTDGHAVTPAALASTLVEAYPEVAAATPIVSRSALLSVGDQHFWEDGIWAGPPFFEIFTVPMLHGDRETALAEPHSIVLTESLARKVFGAENPVGRTLVYDNQEPYTVTGVLADVPATSSLPYAFVADFPRSLIERDNVWNSNNTHTFLLLAEATDAAPLEAKLPALVDVYVVMHRWLGGFAYHIPVSPGIYVLTGGIVVFMALLTVSYQSIKAARADPVQRLRNE